MRLAVVAFAIAGISESSESIATSGTRLAGRPLKPSRIIRHRFPYVRGYDEKKRARISSGTAFGEMLDGTS
jgi:hypothetical protein